MILYGMRVPVAVWRLCELLYTCYFTLLLLYSTMGWVRCPLKLPHLLGRYSPRLLVHPSPYRKALSDSFEIIGAI